MNQRCAKERKYNDSNRRQHYFAFKLKENWGLNFCSEHLCVPKHIHITKMTSYKMMHFTKHYHYKSSTVRANLYFENLNRKPIFFLSYTAWRHPWSAQRNCRWKAWEARSDISRCQAGFGFMIRSVFLLDFGCFCVFVSPPPPSMIYNADLSLARRSLRSHPLRAPADGRGERTEAVYWGEATVNQSELFIAISKITDCLYRKERKGERLLCLRTLERVINLVIEQ